MGLYRYRNQNKGGKRMAKLDIQEIQDLRKYYESSGYHVTSRSTEYLGDLYAESVLDPLGTLATPEIIREAKHYLICENNQGGTYKIDRDRVFELVSWVESNFYDDGGQPIILQPYEHFILGQLVGYGDQTIRNVFLTGNKLHAIRIHAYYILYMFISNTRNGIHTRDSMIVNSTFKKAEETLDEVYKVYKNSNYNNIVKKYNNYMKINIEGKSFAIRTYNYKNTYDGKSKIVFYGDIENFNNRGKTTRSSNQYGWISYANKSSIHYFNNLEEIDNKYSVFTLSKLKDRSRRKKVGDSSSYDDVYLLHYEDGPTQTLRQLLAIDPLLLCQTNEEISNLAEQHNIMLV